MGERAVYIGISDDGLLVANTGDAFDFSDPDRRKSLRILGHSETGEETIGQFGVGLTSIRSMGEAYEVWTKAPDQDGILEPQDCWRVFCGPRTTLAAIASADTDALNSKEGKQAYRRFRELVAGGTDVLDFSADTEPLQSVPLSADQIPYFTYPVAMQSWHEPRGAASTGPLRRRAHDLLTYGHEVGPAFDSLPEQIKSLLSDAGAFTTAVFVDYEDEDWRTLFEAITGDRPEPSDEDPATRFEEQAWFDGGDTPRVTPELLLNLGHIDRLVVERLTDDETEDSSSVQDWEVFGRHRVEQDTTATPVTGRHITSGTGTQAVEATEVAVQVETSTTHDRLQAPTGSTSETYSFWEAEFSEKQRYGDYDWFTSAATEGSTVSAEVETTANEKIDVSLLLQTQDSEANLYRPHLYYPIDGVDKQFPYCIHGDFVVQQNRQSLAGSALARNCVVAAEAARLVGHLSETLATADALDPTERAAIPWRLLPTSLRGAEDDTDWPKARELAEKTSGEIPDNAPVRALRAGIYRQLRHQQNVQVVSNDGTQALVGSSGASELGVVFHHDPTVVAGIGALYPIVRCASNELNSEHVLKRADSAIDESIPTETTLSTLLRWLLGTPATTSVAVEPGPEHGEPISTGRILSPDLLANVPDDVSTERAKRLEQLVTGGAAESNIFELLPTRWWTVLQAWSEAINEATDVGCAIAEVPSETGHAVLYATETLGDTADEFPSGETFTPSTSGPYLLPCDPLVQNQDTMGSASSRRTTHVQLVQVESHESRGNNQRQVLRPESEDIDDIVPPAGAGFALYLLSEDAFTKCGGVITKANWGTRKYGGSADLYRTLLKDVADRSTGLLLPDIRFLTTVYDRIELDKSTADLDAVEGSYHARDQIKTLTTSRASVDNLKPRIDARRVTVPATLLQGDEGAPARNTRFGDQFLRHWLAKHTEAPDEESGPVGEFVNAEADQPSQVPIRTDGAIATLPSSIEEQDNLTEGSPSKIVTQLGMLGVSTLPDVRTLLIRGDEAHPDRQSVSWDPTTWPADDTKRLQELQAVLETASGETYLNLLATPPFGPGVSSDHTSNCVVKDFPRMGKPPGEELSEYKVMLTSWVWLSPRTYAEVSATDLADLLEMYGDALADSILETGWSCNHGRGSKQHIDTFVPTLVNWQLRTVTDWNDVDWFHSPTIEGLWTDHNAWGLQYAVLDSVGNRSTAASALPRIDPKASPVSESVWRTLGVKELDELNATEAAHRLNALTEAAIDSKIDPDTATERDTRSPPRLPGVEEIDAWQTLYGTLLGTIGAEVAGRGDHMTLEKLQFLDRVPARDEAGNWLGLSCTDLDKAVYYDSIESDWEDRFVQLGDDQYLLYRPESRFINSEAFEALWEPTAASKKSAKYPETGSESTTQSGTTLLRETLANPDIKYGILAAAPGQETLANDRNKYDTLTDTLRRIKPASFDCNGSETAWQVTPVDGVEGLKLKNVQGESRYAFAYDERVVDPEEPVDLADMFMALYEGGNKDSYKLALLGRDTEGKDDIEAKLRATDVQELETDLRLSGVLLDIDPSIERGALRIPSETGVSGLRKVIASCLQDGEPLPADTKTTLPDTVAETVDVMCDADSRTLRKWAGDLVALSMANRTDELRDILRANMTAESPSEHQLLALGRLEEALSNNRSNRHLPDFGDLLPTSRTRRVTESLHELVAGVRRLDDRTKPDITSLDDLLNHDRRIAWADPVIVGDGTSFSIDTEADTVALTDVIPDDCTWFHLAWCLETADQSPMKTEPAEAVFDTVGVFLGGRRDAQRTAVKAEARDSVSRRGKESSATSSTFTGSSNATLFDQIETDPDWSGFSENLDGDLTATLRSHNSSGGRPSIEQTTDRPRVAELAVLRAAYAALCEMDASIDEIESQLTALEEDENDNYWRTDGGWRQLEKFNLEILPNPKELGRAETEFPTVAFDTTDEGEVGYDVLDLTGWSVRCAGEVSPTTEDDLDVYRDATTLSPVPVEVKSVNSSNPSFKFSLNQYRRAYDFVTPVGGDAAVPYVLLLVEVSASERDGGETTYSVEPCEAIVITCPADLRRLLPARLSPNENENIIDDLILNVLRGGDLIID